MTPALTSTRPVSGSAPFVSAGGLTDWLPRIAITLYVLSLIKFTDRDPLSESAGLQGIIEVFLPLGALVLVASCCLFNRTIPFFATSARYFAIFGGITIISGSRSFSPPLSLAKSCIFLSVLVFAVLTCDAIGVQKAINRLYQSMVLVIVSGLLATAALNGGTYTLLEYDEYSERLRVWILATHPTVVADLAALAFLIGRICKPRPHWAIQTALVLLNIAAGEKSSTAVFVFILILSLVLRLPRLARAAFVSSALAIVIAGVMIASTAGYSVGNLALNVMQPIYGVHITEESSSLNGRTELWQAVEEVVQRRLILGSGFDGARQELLTRVPWAGHAHNGFIELLLTGGILGAFCAVAGWAASAWACFRAASEIRLPLRCLQLYLFGVALAAPTPVNLQFLGFLLMIWCEVLALRSISGENGAVEREDFISGYSLPREPFRAASPLHAASLTLPSGQAYGVNRRPT
jgi:O-antigen ligase